MSTKAYKVTIMNYGEPMIAYHYNKTKKEILEGYALEGLKVIKIEKAEEPAMIKGPKALERLIDNKVFISLGRIQGKKQFANDMNIIKKELKVLEIIKVKKVNVSALLELDNFTEYNHYCDMVGGCKKLTSEEYDLVREVL